MPTERWAHCLVSWPCDFAGWRRNRTTDTRIFNPPTAASTVTQPQPAPGLNRSDCPLGPIPEARKAWLHRRNRLDQGYASATPRDSTC
jgi:hypothetical protein